MHSAASCRLYKTFTPLTQIPRLHLHNTGRPASDTCHSSDLIQGTELLVIARNAIFLLKIFPTSLDSGPCMTSPHRQHQPDLHLKQKPGSPRRLKLSVTKNPVEIFTVGTPWQKQRAQAPSRTCNSWACQGFPFCLFFLLTTLDCQEVNKTTLPTGMEVAALRHLESIPKKGLLGKAGSTKTPKPFSWDDSYIWCEATWEIILLSFFQSLSKGYSSYFAINGSILFKIIHTIPQLHAALYEGKAEEQKFGPAITDTKEATLLQRLNLGPISWPEELVAYEPASAIPSFTPAIPVVGKEK